MNARLLVLPSLCLGGAALLLAPASDSHAFSKIGFNLAETQRDVRVFDNFLDATANDNAAATAQFPGWTRVELAMWKGIVEWGSTLHGDGSGDPLGGNQLGSGGANFDAMWSGSASGIGGINDNIASSLANCGGGGTLAFTESPSSNGWRIRFCDEWTWDDGPAGVSGRWDIQSVMCHEYGHALGMGHSGVGSATMAPSGSAGQTGLRSIAPDDISGIQCVYGAASGTKPVITATVASAGTLTIHGTNFGATNNEVWFTNGTVSATGSDPIVRVAGLASSNGGTLINVTIPGTAGPGDVIVNKSGVGNATVSNAFPTDLVGTFGNPPGTHPTLTLVSPTTVDALIPGTDQTVTLVGTNLDLVTSVLLDGNPLAPGSFTIFGTDSITLDMPQASSLGVHTLSVTDGVASDDVGITIVAPSVPLYQLGNGNPLNVVDRDNGIDLIFSGPVGKQHRLYGSTSNVPSNGPVLNLDIGNHFTNLINGGQFVIPPKGWVLLHFGVGSMPNVGPGGLDLYSQTVQLFPPTPYLSSNLQSVHIVQ